MIKCIIVDDEFPAREELKFLLKEFENIKVIGEATHGLEAIEINEKVKPDLMFLDIQMPQMSGIDVAESLIKTEHMPFIVFVTAFEEYAIKAFEVNAIDYILKPISKNRLSKTIKKVMNTTETKNGTFEQKIERFLLDMRKENYAKTNKISIYKEGKLIPVDPHEIIYVTVKARNTLIVSTKGRFESNNTLTQIEERLNLPTFFRCHKSFLINLDYISEIVPWFNSTFLIKMKNINDEIYVSRGQAKEFKKIMNIL